MDPMQPRAMCVLLLLLWGCHGAPPTTRELTVAFPLAHHPRPYAVERFLQGMEADGLVRGARMEGLPKGTVTLHMDPAWLHALGRRVEDVRAAVQDKFDPMVPWKAGRDSLELRVPMDFLQEEMTLDELRHLPVPGSGEAPPVPLGDLATVEALEDSRVVLVGGRPCMVIRGMTTATDEVLTARLTALGEELHLVYTVEMTDEAR